jgi:hypothetical protein
VSAVIKELVDGKLSRDQLLAEAVVYNDLKRSAASLNSRTPWIERTTVRRRNCHEAKPLIAKYEAF